MRNIKLARASMISKHFQYFVANDIGGEAKKHAILLSIYGITKPSDQSYEDLVKLIREHFYSRQLEIVQRFHLNSRV